MNKANSLAPSFTHYLLKPDGVHNPATKTHASGFSSTPRLATVVGLLLLLQEEKNNSLCTILSASDNSPRTREAL
jgi:hypothetical protein